jgi:hypothetical protein
MYIYTRNRKLNAQRTKGPDPIHACILLPISHACILLLISHMRYNVGDEWGGMDETREALL